MHRERAANVVGAFATALGDRLAERSRLTVRHGASAPAALAAAANYDALSIERLRHILGLSHPGTVRLVDRLQADGLVVRRPVADGRVVDVRLTARGRARVKRLFSEREALVDDALAGLAPAERDTVVDLLGRMLDATIDDTTQAESTCRLCRHHACNATGGCPIAA
jgi:MarR family transcriptional regulator, negative regulator of the multidrug operon emrRAB